MDRDSLLGLLLGEELRVDQELSDLGSLVTLELDDLPGLVVLDDGTVAGKLLREDKKIEKRSEGVERIRDEDTMQADEHACASEGGHAPS